MSKKLWEASPSQKKNSLLYKYEQFISKKFKKNFRNQYKNILDWSINSTQDFWSSVWDFSKIEGFKNNSKIALHQVYSNSCF